MKKFDLGQTVATPAALKAISEAGQSPDFFLDKHIQGDWGEVDAEDKKANDLALIDGSRLLSAYRTLKGERLWVITEATDDEGQRASTCLLLPQEY
jgi:hypothetical protein